MLTSFYKQQDQTRLAVHERTTKLSRKLLFTFLLDVSGCGILNNFTTCVPRARLVFEINICNVLNKYLAVAESTTTKLFNILMTFVIIFATVLKKVISCILNKQLPPSPLFMTIPKGMMCYWHSRVFKLTIELLDR